MCNMVHTLSPLYNTPNPFISPVSTPAPNWLLFLKTVFFFCGIIFPLSLSRYTPCNKLWWFSLLYPFPVVLQLNVNSVSLKMLYLVIFFLLSLWTIFTLCWDFCKILLAGLLASNSSSQWVQPSWYCHILQLMDYSCTSNTILFLRWSPLPTMMALWHMLYCSVHLLYSVIKSKINFPDGSSSQ